MTLAKAKAKTKERFIVQASLMIITYDGQNMFIVQSVFTSPHGTTLMAYADVRTDVAQMLDRLLSTHPSEHLFSFSSGISHSWIRPHRLRLVSCLFYSMRNQ
jgi:hypothetical protein